jgi:pimeloyl-ACP methyl ester carboxylesterase
MKRVFVSVVNTHLDGEFSQITAPTLLLWGEKDNQTPIYMARRMSKLIKDSRLVTLKGCGHFAFLDDTRAFLCELSRFYGGEK